MIGSQESSSFEETAAADRDERKRKNKTPVKQFYAELETSSFP